MIYLHLEFAVMQHSVFPCASFFLKGAFKIEDKKFFRLAGFGIIEIQELLATETIKNNAIKIHCTSGGCRGIEVCDLLLHGKFPCIFAICGYLLHPVSFSYL